MRENFLTSDLSISGNFQQLWFLWQKSPPPQDEGKFFDIRSIHFRQFPATLVFVAEKPPPPFSAFSSETGFVSTGLPKVRLQIHTQIPPSLWFLLGYQLCQLFKILTFTETATQDHGAYGRPIGSPTTMTQNPCYHFLLPKHYVISGNFKATLV